MFTVVTAWVISSFMMKDDIKHTLITLEKMKMAFNPDRVHSGEQIITYIDNIIKRVENET